MSKDGIFSFFQLYFDSNPFQLGRCFFIRKLFWKNTRAIRTKTKTISEHYGLQPATLLEKKFRQSCFPVSCVIFSRGRPCIGMLQSHYHVRLSLSVFNQVEINHENLFRLIFETQIYIQIQIRCFMSFPIATDY